MPANKDFKRLVRGRMQKTGESYTAARAILLKKPTSRTPAPPPARPNYAALAGMTDTAVKARTGRDWAHWVDVLDAVKAATWPHRDIAGYVHTTLGVPDWWAQTVTVGYERIKGLREIGQRRGGSYEASRSKTVAASVERLYKAFTDTRLRKKWLGDVELTIRRATPHKWVRITWGDGTAVDVGLLPKGEARSSVQLTHRKLTSREDIARLKAYWGERLEALARLLG